MTKIFRSAIVIVILILSSINITAQNIDYKTNLPSRSFVQDRYLHDNEGNIRMSVNVWGHINFPGNYLVYDGIDLMTLLSLAGGLKEGAKLKEIKLFREYPDSLGQQLKIVNLEYFFSSGDRQHLPTILPNDSFYIPQKMSNYILAHANLFDTLINAINLTLLAIIRSNQVTISTNQANDN